MALTLKRGKTPQAELLGSVLEDMQAKLPAIAWRIANLISRMTGIDPPEDSPRAYPSSSRSTCSAPPSLDKMDSSAGKKVRVANKSPCKKKPPARRSKTSRPADVTVLFVKKSPKYVVCYIWSE